MRGFAVICGCFAVADCAWWMMVCVLGALCFMLGAVLCVADGLCRVVGVGSCLVGGL